MDCADTGGTAITTAMRAAATRSSIFRFRVTNALLFSWGGKVYHPAVAFLATPGGLLLKQLMSANIREVLDFSYIFSEK